MSRKSSRVVWISTLLALAVIQVGVTAATTARAAEKGSSSFGDKLQVTIDREKVDLKRHRLEVVMDRPVSKIELKVLGENKQVLAEETFTPRESAGDAITLRWSPSSDESVARIELRAFDAEEHWVGVAIDTWNVEIQHEEVHFDTDSALIKSSEVPKLKDSRDKIRDKLRGYKGQGKVQLFIAGYTDTQGKDDYNLELSRRRAQSIAAWFAKSGLNMPVAFEGFGETSLLVQTKDEVDEPRNRRVKYLLQVDAPPLKRERGFQWRYINKPSK